MSDINNKVHLLAALKAKKIAKARESFYEYCKLLWPDFFTSNKMYLKELCDTLQALYEGKLLKKNGQPYKNISINLPPGFGKSFTATLFSQWVLGKNHKKQIITASYNEDFASTFSKNVRDAIGTTANHPSEIAYADIFPNSKIKRGDSAKMKWSLEGHYMNYLATSPNGSVTGSRAHIHVIDDLVKDAYEAMNQRILEEKWTWFKDTLRSRLLPGGLRIVISTRWSVSDLTGRLIEMAPDDWYELKMPACLDEESQEMLCDELCSWERYCEEREYVSDHIFLANYQQQPISVFGKLYNLLKTYKDIPRDDYKKPMFENKICYVDSADKGKDYLAAIVAGVYKKELYILDILYTKDDMSITEKKTAEMVYQNEVNEVIIEGNNGGEGFSRSIQRILEEEYDCKHIKVKTFHQSKNKESRILSMSSYVEKLVYFPENWGKRWTDFFISMNSFQRDFKKNLNDDAQDAITGLVEQIEFGKKPVKAVPSLPL